MTSARSCLASALWQCAMRPCQMPVPYVRREICSLPSGHLCDHGHSQRPRGFSPSICEMRLAKHCLGSSCESLNQSVYLACEITTVLPVCYYFLFD